ncbi:hypothetical protein [uncultured Tenacibaculum sp.]|uniref:hypothetical protein n=1 Tax=uncultured Tenacibaculum sp. TaxID=174713 RepID=UPI0026254748|nr:hypothetical protein [uncultured Tenacibaculum sp.]
MEFKSLKIGIILFMFIQTINAQHKLKRAHLYNSYTGLNADTDLFNDISLNSFEAISTNIQFSKNNDLQKIVVVPMKLRSPNYENYNFLFNTKLNLAQKGGITTFGIGFTFDNSIAESKRGIKILEKINPNFNESYLNKKRILDKKLKKKLTEDLIKYKDTLLVNLIEKVLNKLEENKDGFFLEDLFFDPINDSQKYTYYKNLKQSYDKSTKAFLDYLSIDYYKKLMENSTKITFGGNISFFEILGGDKIDLDNDGLIDNAENIKQKNLSLGITRIESEKLGWSFTGYYLQKRSSPKSGEKFNDYYGFSAAVGQRIFILNKEYKKTKEYIEGLFISSIHAGLSFEYLKCNESIAKCENGISKKSIITPYIELKISPKNQFRIGIPITNQKQLDNSQSLIGPFLQYRLNIAGSN